MGFGRYVTARVLWAAVVSLIIVTVTFLLLSAAPNPAVQRAATQAALQGGDPAEAAERARELRGLNQPLYVRYFDFIRNVYTLEWENAIQLAIPVFVLVTGSIGAVMRVSRNESAEFQNADFMKTAKAKGVSPLRAYAYHVMRPTLVPLSTTLVGQLLALFLGASLLVEVVFSIPGLGRLTYEALLAQDTNLVLGTTLFFTFVAVIGNLIEDLVFTVLDPRISYDDR